MGANLDLWFINDEAFDETGPQGISVDIKDRFSKKKKEMEIPESKKLCPEVIDIKRAVCRHYKIGEADLQNSRRGLENEARDLAIYPGESQKLRFYTLWKVHLALLQSPSFYLSSH